MLFGDFMYVVINNSRSVEKIHKFGQHSGNEQRKTYLIQNMLHVNALTVVSEHLQKNRKFGIVTC